jgi:predicted kinase
LLDANFASAALREQATECARSAGAQIALVWFQAQDRQIELRMMQRAEDADRISDADLETYRKLQTTFQPPSEDEVGKLIVAPAAGELELRVAAILRQLI